MGLLEAFAYGLPCLVTPGTNLSQEIYDYDAGWIASLDSDSIAEKMLSIIAASNETLAEKSKGKKIQGVDEALAAFEKYKNVLDKKFSKVDRDAIFNALESVNYDELSKNLTKISKSLKITSRVSFLYDVGSDFKNAIETGNWRPLFVTLEKSAVDVGVAKIVALMFSFIVGVPLGFWGIAIVTGIVSSYIGDDELSKLNELLGI